MRKPNDIPRSRRHVLDAVDACAGALRAIELAEVETPEEDDKRRQRLVHAIQSLRTTMSELRAIERSDSSKIPNGFVLPRRPGPA